MSKRQRSKERQVEETHEPTFTRTPPAMEVVSGDGPVRRIVFDEPESYRRVEAAPKPAPEPTPAPAPEPEPAREYRRYDPYRPRRDMEAIHREIDSLGRTRYYGTPTVKTERRIESRTVYKTGGGAVRESEYHGSEGSRKVLYVAKGNPAITDERRFVSSMVDRVVKGVHMPATVNTQEETPWSPPQERLSPPPLRETVTVTTTKTTTKSTKAKATKATKAKATKPATKAKAPKATDAAPKTKKAATKKASKLYYDYGGDIHPVVEIEGIGKTYEKKLNDMGIMTTARLCYVEAAKIAKGTGAPTKTVRSWQTMAELAKVTGIGPQYAEALTRAGVKGIEELKTGDAEKLAAKVNKYLDSLETNVIGTKITAKRIATWQDAAKPMRRVRQHIPEN